MTSLFQFRPGVEFSPNLDFGCVLIRGINHSDLKCRILIEKDAAFELLRRQSDRLRNNIQQYSEYFETNGHKNPIAHQLKAVLKQGFSTVNPLVDTLLIVEMTTGHLMGVQDWSKVEGQLLYDLASEGEAFDGMRKRIVCHAGDVVLRDDKGIIASYFQGPDSRTQVNNETTDVIFFAFSAPGIEGSSLKTSLERAAELCDPSGSRCEFAVLSPM